MVYFWAINSKIQWTQWTPDIPAITGDGLKYFVVCLPYFGFWLRSLNNIPVICFDTYVFRNWISSKSNTTNPFKKAGCSILRHPSQLQHFEIFTDRLIGLLVKFYFMHQFKIFSYIILYWYIYIYQLLFQK